MLKKILLLSVILFSNTQAEYSGFEIGIKTMKSNFESLLRHYGNESSIDENDLDLDNQDINTVWFIFDHPIPILPNFKASISTFVASGTPSKLTWDNKSYVDFVKTKIDLSYKEYVFYYRLIENMIKFNLGYGFRSYEGVIVFEDTSSNDYYLSLENVFPIVNMEIGTMIPSMPVLIQGNLIYISTSDHKISDYYIELKYTHQSNIGMQLGYRDYLFTLIDKNNINAKFEMSGLYYGIHYQF